MQWYLVKLVYKIECSEMEQTEFDEQIRIIHAEDELHAFQKSRLIGEKEGQIQVQCAGSLMCWKFIDVAEIHKVETAVDGAEVFSQIRTKKNADGYVREVQRKALYLFDQAVNRFLI